MIRMTIRMLQRAIRFMARFTGPEKGVPAELLFDHDGVKAYGWATINQVPSRRFLAHIIAANDAELGITRDDLKALVDNVRKSHNEGEHTRTGFFIETIAAYMDIYPPEKVIFQMIAPLIMIEGEKEHILDPEITKRKAALYGASPEFRAFFLSYGHGIATQSGALSRHTPKKDFISQVPTIEEKTFSKLTGNATYRDYLSA